MLVRKTLNLDAVDLKFDGERGTFAGYASVFGGVDSYGDTIVRGAFASSLKRNGKPKMFYNHDWHMPIGKYVVAKEDEKGLWVEGEFTPDLTLSSEVRAAMKHGTVDGLSIGGFIKKGDYEETEGGRVIRRWDNLVEVSPVVFPADSAARVDAGSIKSTDIDLEGIETVRDFERFLRDVGGLSKGAAVALVARAKAILIRGEPDEEGAEAKLERALVDRVSRVASIRP